MAKISRRRFLKQADATAVSLTILRPQGCL